MPSLHIAAANRSDSPHIRSEAQRRVVSKHVLTVALWAVAIAVAFALDGSIALELRHSGIAHAIKFGGFVKDVAKFAGYFWYPLALVIALLIWHPLHWRATVFLSLCAIIAGSNSILKWMVGRLRPFKLLPYDSAQAFRCSPFNGGLTGLVHQSSDLSFVSGHTTLAFATAAGMAILFPRKRAIAFLVYIIAVIVGLERVGENAHWLSDVVCGAALGVWGVALLTFFCGRLLFPVEA